MEFLCFRGFINSKNFRNVYKVDNATFDIINTNDVELMKFGFRLLHQVLFGEDTIDLVDGIFEKRMSERGPILAQRREMEIEIEVAKEQDVVDKFIND